LAEGKVAPGVFLCLISYRQWKTSVSAQKSLIGRALLKMTQFLVLKYISTYT